MLRYIIGRIMAALVVAILVMSLLASIATILPGDPARLILGPRASSDQIELVRQQMGLDDPVIVQIWTFAVRAIRLDFGRDFINQIPVAEIVGSALPHTIALAVSALALAFVAGVVIGSLSARFEGSLVERSTGTILVIFLSTPSYVIGLFLLLAFAVRLRWFPAQGAGTLHEPLGYLRALVLPASSLAVFWAAYIARLLRANMIEVQSLPYIRVATAFGLPPSVITFQYALRNAVIPLVAVLGVGLGSLLGGAIFIELIFSRPGLGTTLVSAIEVRNFPVVRGTVLTISLLFIASNLMADLSYRFLDPRIQDGAGT